MGERMKKLLVCLTLICGMSFLNSESITVSKPETDKNTTISIVSPESPAATPQIHRRLNQCLQILEDDYLGKLGATDQRNALDLLHEIRELLSLLGNQTNIKINLNDQGIPLPQPISEDNLQTLKRNLYQGMYDDTILSTLSSAAEDNYFTVSQIAGILQYLSYTEDKDEALYLLFPKCLDKENKLQLLNSFLFDDQIDEVRDYLNKH